MNRDPFLRLALIVSVSAYAVAIAVVWRQLGWPAGLAGLAAGVPGALGLSVEQHDDEADAERAKRYWPHRPRMPVRPGFIEDDE